MKFFNFSSNKPSNIEYLRAILCAPVYEIAKVTSLEMMKKTSYRFKNTILVKREDQQIVNSFKLRGAYTMIASLNNRQKNGGVITASAGNHAQGVALSAKKLGIKSLIIMPYSTSNIKIDAVKQFGGKVFLFGKNFDEAKEKALNIAKQKKYTFIPPFDHPYIIAGQGTIGLELLQQDVHINKIFIPVGGGGLASGIAVLIKQLMPKIKIIAVESKDSACLQEALKKGKPSKLSYVGLFAEGVAVKCIGKENFRICKENIDDIINVDNDAICSAIKDIFEDTRAIAEPAGALALAGLKKYVRKFNIKNEKLAYILSGSNFNFHSLRYVSERCELGEKQEALFAVTIPEKQKSFLTFCQLLGNKIITEFNYRYKTSTNAQILVGIKLIGINERYEILNLLNDKNYSVIDLSDNEIAKLHIRYMIGGQPKKILKEKFYNFIFPESEGALLRFLKLLSDYCNITLFHYRSYGTDYGRVLVGFESNKYLFSKFKKQLTLLGYEFYDETLNPIFKFFL